MIGIIGAMDEEVVHLKDLISELETTTMAGIEFYSGVLEGIKVCLVRSGIGKVNAAIATTLLLDHFSPSHILNTGCAGGTAMDCNVGDIVISKNVIHHDANNTCFGYKIGQIPREPESYLADSQLIDWAQLSIDEIELKGHAGLIGSGDTFMCDPEHISRVKQTFDGILALDMEAAGIAQACHKFGVPFVVTRALSDIAGKESVDYQEFLPIAVKNSSDIVLKLIKKIL